jgi:hypothetical protein
MPLPAYRAKQSTNDAGTGTIVLNAAASNARSFAAAFGASSRRILYMIQWSTGFEFGLGDFNGGTPGSLTRATVLLSSNSNALVTLPTGTKDVFAVFAPAAREVVSVSASTTLALADLGNAVVFTGSTAGAFVLLPAIATVPLGAGWLVINSGTVALTIDPNGAELINGAATLVLQPGQSAQVFREASAWRAAVMMGPNVTGNLSVSGEVQSTGPIRMQAGTALLPGITPTGDPDTGFHAPGANILAVSLGGVEVARWEGGRYQIAGSDGATLQRVAGASYALRLQSLAATGMNVEAVNPTEASFQPLLLGGSTVTLRTSGTARVTVPASGAVDVVGPLAIDGNNVGINRGTEQATTSGVSIDFTSIPAGVRRVTVLFDRVSTNGTSPIMVQLGISTGIEATGYTVGGTRAGSNNFASHAAYTTGFAFGDSSAMVAAQLYTGRLQLDLFNVTNNSFVGNGFISSNTAGGYALFTSGRKALAGVLDRLRITTVNGTDTFDNGAAIIMWEF